MTARADRWLIVSDIDDTLTGDAAALARLGAALTRAGGRVALALNSSRPHASVAATLAREFPTSFPIAAIVTAMGTQIQLRGAPCQDWHARFADWPRAAIHATVTTLGYPPHAPEFQAPAKASYRVPAGADLDRVRQALTSSGLPHRLIHSGRDDLDILPPGADKGAAALFLAEKLGISSNCLVAAGDSGNDLSMFEIAAHSIAVGNARAELLGAMPGATSYHAHAPHAAGVLEGLIHWGVLPPAA